MIVQYVALQEVTVHSITFHNIIFLSCPVLYIIIHYTTALYIILLLCTYTNFNMLLLTSLHLYSACTQHHAIPSHTTPSQTTLHTTIHHTITDNTTLHTTPYSAYGIQYPIYTYCTVHQEHRCRCGLRDSCVSLSC